MALYEFYGDTCPHCIDMAPLVDSLIKEGINIEKLETWQNPENAKLQKKYDNELCGGVPFFYNTESKQFICGEADEKTLRAWAAGETLLKS